MSDAVSPDQSKIWGPWGTIGLGIACGLILFIVQLVVIVAIGAIRARADLQFDLLAFAKNLASDGSVLSIISCVKAAVGVTLVAWAVKLRKGYHFSKYMALNPISKKWIFVSIALAAGLVILSDGTSALLGKSIVSQWMVYSYQSKQSTVMYWLAIVIAAPVFEEILFRGFLLRGLKQSRLKDCGAIILTAVSWAMLHVQYDLYGIVTIFIFGCVLGFVRVRTNSLWSVLIMHGFINLVATIETAIYVGTVGG